MLVKWPQIKQKKCQKGVHMISVNVYNFIANINPCKNNVYITCTFNRISTVATAAW